VLTEGYDEPGIDCIILARPTKSALLYTQMIGRGTRPAPGKDDCLILDCADNSGRHDLVSVSTLFGLPPQLDLEGQDAIEVSEQFEIEESRHPWIDYSKVRTLEELGAAATRIDFFASAVPAALQAWTTYQWIPISDGGYKLPMPKQEAVIVRPTRLDTFKAAYVRPGVEKKTRDWTKIGEFDTLREAIQAGDRAVSEFQEDATKLLDTRARWRSGSASEKQIALIKRMGIAVPEGITKGQAATVLTLTFNRKRSR